MKKMIKYEMFKDQNGKISSTRVQSWSMQKFFYAFNILFLILMIVLIALSLSEAAIIDPSIFVFICLTWWFLDALLLLAIFAPKQLAKKIELSEIVELASKAITTKK